MRNLLKALILLINFVSIIFGAMIPQLSQIKVSKRVFNNKIVKVYERRYAEKQYTHALLFYTGANSLIPGDIYSNFINSLNNYNFSVIIAPNNQKANNLLLDNIINEYKSIIPLSHSSGYINAINTINTFDTIKNAIFLDPVDNSLLYKKIPRNINSKIQNVLIINAEKSYRWSLYPLQIPFIPFFSLDIKKFKEELSNNNDNNNNDNNDNNNDNRKNININININKIEATNFGHSDILDTLWSDLMHVTLSRGNKNRDQDYLNLYIQWISEQIINFINENDLKEYNINENDLKEDNINENDLKEDNINENDLKEYNINENDLKEYNLSPSSEE